MKTYLNYIENLQIVNIKENIEANKDIDRLEEQFLEIAHIDELEIRFDFILYRSKYLIYYYYDNIRYFIYSKYTKQFNLDESVINDIRKVWYKYSRTGLYDIVKHHFKLNDITVIDY